MPAVTGEKKKSAEREGAARNLKKRVAMKKKAKRD